MRAKVRRKKQATIGYQMVGPKLFFRTVCIIWLQSYSYEGQFDYTNIIGICKNVQCTDTLN